MLYKLAFSKTSDGLLRITASSGRSSDHVIAIYEDEEVFLRLASHARFSADVEAALKLLVHIALGPSQTPACCEEIDLADDQLALLRLGAARRLYA
ncbi:hypothetical protein [Granulicella arctica]|uniref:hypothetical protein n=1 Tax=Granulicella arctica TaxID=940613 RepID=UPI0021DFEA15|nr:hypothetical protein [Granulicella arctica]